MQSLSTDQRLDYLDAVRAFALLLGIFFHASLSFLPYFIGWAVMDVSTSPLVSHFMLISHSFRMELFFLLAGFFSHLTFHRKGLRTFSFSRLLRIGLPFVLGWFLVRPLLVSGWIMGGESLRGEVHVWTALRLGFQSLEALPNGLLVGSHLWFLYYLLLVTLIALVLRALIKPIIDKKELGNALDRIAEKVSGARSFILLVSIPTALCMENMSYWAVETPDKSLIPTLPVLLLYLGFFTFGWILNRSRNLIERFAAIRISTMAIAVLSITACLLLQCFQTDPGHPHYTLLHRLFCYSYSAMMWSLVSLSIGSFKLICRRPNRIVRYFADASYWLYLVHLPIVVWLQVAFAELPWHWSIKLVSIFLITIASSLLLYDLFVRSSFLGRILNGRKKPNLLSVLRATPSKSIPAKASTSVSQ